MKLAKADFVLMRWNILAISASLLISVLALYSSGEYAANADRERRSALSQLNEARNRLNTAHEDQNNMAIYADEYGVLVSRKIVTANHDRLDWMEGLENIRRQNPGVEFRYNIAPQKIYAPQPPIDGGNFDINYSEMKLQFDLLHEGQLLDFFKTLKKQIKGHYQLEGCTLKRVAPPIDVDDEDDNNAASVAANIKAECSGGWITLKNRNAPQ